VTLTEKKENLLKKEQKNRKREHCKTIIKCLYDQFHATAALGFMQHSVTVLGCEETHLLREFSHLSC